MAIAALLVWIGLQIDVGNIWLNTLTKNFLVLIFLGLAIFSERKQILPLLKKLLKREWA
jgi:hypothetical protein